MPSGADKVEAAVDTRILNVPVTHSRQFLAQIRAVLVLDVFHDGVPATTHHENTSHHKICHPPVFIVDLVTVPRRVDNVQAKLDTVFSDHCPTCGQYDREPTSFERHTMRNSLNLGRLSDRVVRFQTTLGVNQVRRENSVDERRLSETGLPYIFSVPCRYFNSSEGITTHQPQ